MTEIKPRMMIQRVFIVVPLVVFASHSTVALAQEAAPPNANQPVQELIEFLNRPDGDLKKVIDQPFAKLALSKSQCQQANERIVEVWRNRNRERAAAELRAGELTDGKFKMPFTLKKFGNMPGDGWSVFISMHGGGGTAKRVNDQQWENQKRLYQLKEGIYVTPRAPTDTWNMWHQEHIDKFYDQLITNLILAENVNPDRVYLLGYSAGGDGVYQLAPRMADRFAAAAMMAGHPNETSPLGLRNLPFTIHVGALDRGFARNIQASNWKQKLADLQRQDQQGYDHQVTIHEGLGHWMKRRDAVAIDWMATRSRNRFPDQVVWQQDDVTHQRFYWLAVASPPQTERACVVASRQQHVFKIVKSDIDSVIVLLNDQMVDLDQPLTVRWQDQVVFAGKTDRTIKNIAKSLLERGDPRMTFSAVIEVKRP